ncbi:hypothetical protein TWF970_004852 [Orbilia oligospora]|uniref:Uncharacterized protein n=1 Tax=Orbilia oligospora TaxID=2813651 RepID=A0A7C8RCQ1_ORBOL|nr:hypothetical protein TWF970_004852 [Orbilia oligospora]
MSMKFHYKCCYCDDLFHDNGDEDQDLEPCDDTNCKEYEDEPPKKGRSGVRKKKNVIVRDKYICITCMKSIYPRPQFGRLFGLGLVGKYAPIASRSIFGDPKWPEYPPGWNFHWSPEILIMGARARKWAN